MESGTIIEHYGHRGRVLRFENRKGFFPVNRDQSLLMASNALIEAVLAENAHPFEDFVQESQVVVETRPPHTSEKARRA